MQRSHIIFINNEPDPVEKRKTELALYIEKTDVTNSKLKLLESLIASLG